MIRINGQKLIIEIDCGEYRAPLALLSDLQKGLINLLGTVPHAIGNYSAEKIDWGVSKVTELLGEMAISNDQFEHLNDSLTETQLKEFNRWGHSPVQPKSE